MLWKWEEDISFPAPARKIFNSSYDSFPSHKRAFFRSLSLFRDSAFSYHMVPSPCWLSRDLSKKLKQRDAKGMLTPKSSSEVPESVLDGQHGCQERSHICERDLHLLLQKINIRSGWKLTFYTSWPVQDLSPSGWS